MTSAAWLTRASGPWAEPQSVAYLVNGDRRSVNDKAYCYEPGSHRLARVADVLYRSNPEGAIWKREAPDGRATTYCWNPVGQLGALIDSGGQATGFVYNHRRQRVAEIWPINGLRAEYRTDATSRLTSEELPGSLQQEFPRAIREYVWLGDQPMAIIRSKRAADGTTPATWASPSSKPTNSAT